MFKNFFSFLYDFFCFYKQHGIKHTLRKIKSYCIDLCNNEISLDLNRLEVIPGLTQGSRIAMRQAKKLLSIDFNAYCNIGKSCYCVCGHNTNFTGQHTVILSHWDQDAVIDKYVIRICQHFKELNYKVVVSSGNKLNLEDLDANWNTWADAIVYYTNNGYDITGWKAAIECFPSILQSKELTLTNDSYFGPINSFNTMQTIMSARDCDFWGATLLNKPLPHLQKNYIVLKEHVVNHISFKKFINTIPLDCNQKISHDFEQSLTLWLQMHGFKIDAYYIFEPNQTKKDALLMFCMEIVKHGLPFLSRKKFFYYEPLLDFFNFIDDCTLNYDWNIIYAYMQRINMQSITDKNFAEKVNNLITQQDSNLTLYNDFPSSVMPLRKDIKLNEVKCRVPFAVALHCYYVEELPSLLIYLNNLPKIASIFVTTDTEQKKNSIYEMLLPLGLEKLEVRICPNTGWDIGPFLIGLQDVIKNYEFILKIHPKKSTHMDSKLLKLWRTTLYDALLGTPQRIENILAYLRDNDDIGFIAPPIGLSSLRIAQGVNQEALQALLKRLSIHLPHDAVIDFPAGSMFFARSSALQPLCDLNLSYDDFLETHTKRDATLGHAIERAFFFSGGVNNLKWGRVDSVKTLGDIYKNITNSNKQ